MDMLVVTNWGSVVNSLLTVVTTLIFDVLCVLILLDIATGKTKALKIGDIDSSIGTHGLMKHSMVLIINVLAGMFVVLVQAEYLGYVFTSFYILEYVTSIIENLDAIGVPFPDSFRKYFRRMEEEHAEIEISKRGVK